MGEFFEMGKKVTGEVIEGEAVIMNLDTGRYFSTEKSGAVVWSCIEANLSKAAIVEAFAKAYSLPMDRAEQDVSAFVATLEENGLVASVSTLKGEPVEPAIQSIDTSGEYAAPALMVYEDMKDLLLLDPIHEANDSGWPQAIPTSNPNGN